jgi:hypothetical protein
MRLALLSLIVCSGLLPSAAFAQALVHPRDQIALQLGALQMGYDSPFTLSATPSSAERQLAINALVQGRLSLATLNGRVPVHVVGARNLPANLEAFREQLDLAVEAVMRAPAKVQLRGRATLSNNKTTPAITAVLTPPSPAWMIPLPYSLDAKYSAQSGPAGPPGEKGETGPQGPPGPGVGGVNPSLAGSNSFIGGGENNSASDDWSTVGGGFGNAVVTGAPLGTNPWNNQLRPSKYATIAGGLSNKIEGGAYAFIGGGIQNYTSGGGAIAGGMSNSSLGYFSFVGAGLKNVANGNCPFIGGGVENSTDGYLPTVVGGLRNMAGDLAFVGGGDNNDAQGTFGFVGGGVGNSASATASAVAGGGANTNSGEGSFIGGGTYNSVDSSAPYAVVAGGQSNTVSGPYAIVPGGYLNVAGTNSFAAGVLAKATNSGSFVWSGSSAVETVSTNDNSFTVRATGGVRFITSLATNGLGVGQGGMQNGVVLMPGETSWSSLSDSNAKTAVVSVDPRAILAKIDRLPVGEWEYKHAPQRRYFGPMAQDFHAAFGLGNDDKTINTLDADGVLFLSVKGLVEELKERDAKIERLESKLQAFEERLKSLPPQ